MLQLMNSIHAMRSCFIKVTRNREQVTQHTAPSQHVGGFEGAGPLYT